MKITAIPGFPMPHGTPLGTAKIDLEQIMIELDDIEEVKFGLVFRSYQAFRVTTIDCFSLPDEVAVLPQEISEASDSPWLAELKFLLSKCGRGADMEKARHFIIYNQDDVFEVVAESIELRQYGVSSDADS